MIIITRTCKKPNKTINVVVKGERLMTTRGQYKRGTKLRPNEILVARPSRWGNPFRIRKVGDQYQVYSGDTNFGWCLDEQQAHKFAVYMYKLRVLPNLDVTPLRGKILMCYCRPDLPCHVDALIERINAT